MYAGDVTIPLSGAAVRPRPGSGMVVTVVLVALLATSCGSTDSSPDATTVAPSAPSTSTAPPTTTAMTGPRTASGLACTGQGGESGDADPGARPGTERVDPFGIMQVWVPAGSFTMGTADPAAPAALDPPGFAARELAWEQPAHQVTATTGFWIDKYEVTNEAFVAFVDAGGYQDPACWSGPGWDWRQLEAALPVDCETDAADHPRACVTWFEAQAYATWRGGSLPTEAQWEFAARGPASSVFPWGNDWDPQRANVVDATGTVAVGSYPDGTSWVGAHDMSGNVMEWVADWLGMDYYSDSPSFDPPGPDDGRVKVERGAGGAMCRTWRDPPTDTSRIRPTTRTSTSACGWWPIDLSTAAGRPLVRPPG